MKIKFDKFTMRTQYYTVISKIETFIKIAPAGNSKPLNCWFIEFALLLSVWSINKGLIMKTCKKCEQTKPFSSFSKRKSSKDGLKNICKDCVSLANKNYYRTIDGLSSRIYNHQLSSSEQRGHEKPTYSKNEFIEWLKNNDQFLTAFSKWEQSDYDPQLVPSCDRLDDYKGYSFDNIRIISWQENLDKCYKSQMNGENKKQTKKVQKLDFQGFVIDEYFSASEASRINNISLGTLCDCCRGKRKTAKGFRWRYAS